MLIYERFIQQMEKGQLIHFPNCNALSKERKNDHFPKKKKLPRCCNYSGNVSKIALQIFTTLVWKSSFSGRFCGTRWFTIRSNWITMPNPITGSFSREIFTRFLSRVRLLSKFEETWNKYDDCVCKDVHLWTISFWKATSDFTLIFILFHFVEPVNNTIFWANYIESFYIAFCEKLTSVLLKVLYTMFHLSSCFTSIQFYIHIYITGTDIEARLYVLIISIRLQSTLSCDTATCVSLILVWTFIPPGLQNRAKIKQIAMQ